VIEAPIPYRRRTTSLRRIAALNKAKSAARPRADPGHAAPGLFEGRRRCAAEGLPAEPGQSDPGAERYASSQTAWRRPQQTANPRIPARSHPGLSGKAPSINPDTTIFSPIAGRACSARSAPAVRELRASDPVFVIGDLSTVWLTAFVRETDASKVAVNRKSPSTCWRCLAGR